jgi:hypothetical protein
MPPLPPNQPQVPLHGPATLEEDHTRELAQALDALGRIEVLIGIPSDTDQPHYNERQRATQTEARSGGEGIQSNATLGYIHEHGAPSQNIPARPWLGPGVEESKDQWLRYMQQAGQAALTFRQGTAPGTVQPFDPTTMYKALHAAGTTAVSAVKNRIVAGLEPRLSERTVAARRRRTPSRQAMTSADVTPLVDTAQMLNSISYVIKED